MKNRITTAAAPAPVSTDFLKLDGAEMLQLCAAAVEKAIERRERDTAQNAAVMRTKYREDAIQETAARALDMLAGAWIDGESTWKDTETGEAVSAPRAEMPLALFAAIAAGRALDSLIYADGGHNVKLSARERREHYPDANDAPRPDVDELSRLADMATAARGTADYTEAAAAYTEAARAYYGETRPAVTDTGRTSSPVAPAPESAAILADNLSRILAHVNGEAARKTAAALMLKVYSGETLTEAAAALAVSAQYARRVWQAVCNAAALVKVEDGESAELERMIASDTATMTNAERRARAAAVAALARRLEAETEAPAAAVRWTGKNDPAARALAAMSYRERIITNYADFAKLARAIFDNA